MNAGMTLALVTGANRGIGLELTRQLAARGDHVVAACRQSSPELEALGVEVIEGIDVTEPRTLAKLKEKVGERTIDTLVLCAGVLERNSLESMNFDSVQRQIEVNGVGPLRVTHALLGNLRGGSKVAIITSRMGSIGDNTSGGSYGYRMSKAAVNAAGKSLAIDLGDRGVAVGILHPGFVRTDMTGGAGNVTAKESAEQLLARIAELDMASTGHFRHANGEELPW
jgi:NAD(P)-dependent dehydrogenase (short-subunit alcohol dehydrogenase family)